MINERTLSKPLARSVLSISKKVSEALILALLAVKDLQLAKLVYKLLKIHSIHHRKPTISGTRSTNDYWFPTMR